jgi:hypothetical protein
MNTTPVSAPSAAPPTFDWDHHAGCGCTFSRIPVADWRGEGVDCTWVACDKHKLGQATGANPAAAEWPPSDTLLDVLSTHVEQPR